jgi:hypothetical protein
LSSDAAADTSVFDGPVELSEIIAEFMMER